MKLSLRISSGVEKAVIKAAMHVEMPADMTKKVHTNQGMYRIGSLILTPTIRAKLANNPIK